MIANLVSVLDAITSALPGTNLVMHDHSGEIISTLRLWSAQNNVELSRRTLTGSGTTSDVYELLFANNVGVHVHDHLNARVTEGAEESTWRPYQDGAA